MRSQPNILLFMADQMRADALGCVNGWSRTPQLDALARDGTLIDGVFTNSAECIPARISLALGQYPHQTGVQENTLCTLSPEAPNWMQAIQRAGYRTSLFGKTHLHPHAGDLREREHLLHAYGLEHVDETAGPHASATVLTHLTAGWQERGLWQAYREDIAGRVETQRHVVRPTPLSVEDHYDTYVGRQASRYLEALTAGAPWFCWVSFGGPHEPWDAPEPYASLHAGAAIPPPTARMREADRARGLLRAVFDSTLYSPPLTAGEVRAIRQSYAGKVSLIDDQVGAVLDVVRRRGELDDTLIVFTSDHGEMNGDQGLLYKANFLDPVVRVPLVARVPGGRPPNVPSALRTIAELMDLGATLVDYAGGSPPTASQARSLRPLLDGGNGTARDLAVSEFRGQTAMIDERWKAELDPDGTVVLLTDRVADRSEQINRADDPLLEHVRDGFAERFFAFRARTPAPDQRATA